MAPKSLTDCPENLREAIDWLIQVKQGGGITTLCNALRKLFDNVTQDAQKSLSSFPESDDTYARDVISKLQEFQNAVTKDSANLNKNILHNLCSAVEKFIGYQTPGTYDGSGIVYGDASRLCDAVLSFLHVLFTDVYENQPYVAGGVLLGGLVSDLEKAKWTGHHGFSSVIPKVASGLYKYNSAVKASNEKVRKPIDEVIAFVEEGGELLTELNSVQADHATGKPDVEDAQVSKVVGLVEKCKEVAKDFSRRLDSAKTAIGDLNPQLRSKLENSRKSFFNHVGWLSKWSRKGQKKKLDDMIHKIKTRLRRLGKEVKDRIKQEVHALVRLLKERVRKIKRKLEDIRESLAKYVQDLVKWMDEAKSYIDQVKEYVDKILKEIYGENKQKIDEAAGEIDATLSKKVAELNKWIETADSAVQAAMQKAQHVYEQLDHSEKNPPGGTTNICRGIKQITTAKTQVSNVDGQLIQHIGDLGKWKDAASAVLGTAVSRAGEVRDKLDPNLTDDQHKIGHNIEKIKTSNDAIQTANKTLGEQVDSLRSWITTADGIRQKAQEKAEEAYKKLKPHEALTQKIGEIMNANKRIESVHTELGKVHSNLGTWNKQAKDVLTGAIGKATEVYTKLYPNITDKDKENPVGYHLNEITQANGKIQSANTELAGEVDNLGKWNAAAEDVISKAEDKCKAILEKVKTDPKGKDDTIFSKAKKLSEDGTTLLQAAKDAKQAVEEKVTRALQAVVAMDQSLKKDLKGVKKEIREGIWQEIQNIGVLKLNEKVRDDLGTLKQRIEGLKYGLDGDDKKQPLVQKAFHELEKAKTKLDGLAGDGGRIKTQTTQLETNFKDVIQNPLNIAVGAVDSAIGVLGGKFDRKLNSIDGIFGHIRKEVAEIKGKPGDHQGSNAKGLEGIVGGVKRYAEKFKEGAFDTIVEGWVRGSILPNEPMKGWVKKYADIKVKAQFTVPNASGKSSDLQDRIANKVREQLKRTIPDAFTAFAVSDLTPNIAKDLQKVMKACDTFAKQLGNHIKDEGKIAALSKAIAKEIEDRLWGEHKLKDPRYTPGSITDTNLIDAIKGILPVLVSTSWKAANEVEWFTTGAGLTNLSTNVHNALNTATTLEQQLTEATKKSDDGTAQAVDRRLSAVSSKVGGLVQRFNREVKNKLQAEVDQLPNAVDQFNNEAEKQIRDAANTAIVKATNEISKSDVTENDVKRLMSNFHNVYDTIQKGLKRQLDEQVDKHIGKDDTASGQGATITELAGGSFEQYREHVNQDSDGLKNNDLKGKQDEGHLPEAIGKIKTEVDSALKLIDKNGGVGKAKIDSDTFEEPFSYIRDGLIEIAALVDSTQSTQLQLPDPDGVKHHLTDLEEMIKNNGDSEYTLISNDLTNLKVKGLGAITKAIDRLQEGPFHKQPAAIEKAVKDIKAQLKDLREKMKNEEGQPKDDVIETLKDLQEKGLANGDKSWKQIKGQNVSGLEKIEKDLKGQNDKLPEQTKQITSAVTAITVALRGLGFKLNNGLFDDAIIDQLEQLKKKIGQNDVEAGNLQHIHEVIKKLQSRDFSDNSRDIGNANKAIEDELKAQMNTLDKDVIETLGDLISNGLSETWDKNTNGNQKGLDAIKNDLNTQQGILSLQHPAIGQGVDKITTELESLRSELLGEEDSEPQKRGVIKNMEFMIKQIGTKDDDKDSLKKIKKEIATLNRYTVPKVDKYLTAMCEAIQKAGAYAGWHLGQLETTHINGKLNKIKNDIDTLRTGDLQEAIEACDKFLSDADDIERNTVKELEKFVDYEVEDAIAELTKQARRDYVESVQDALKHFANKVAGELGGLPGDIEHDLTIGFKGFMAKLENGFVKNIQKINGIDFKDFSNRSPLSQVAEKVSEAVHGFFPKLMQQEEFLNGGFPKSSDPVNPKNLTDEQVETLESMPANMLQFMSLIDALDDLIQYIEAGGHFDFPFTAPLNSLKKQLAEFTYDAYNDGQRALLRPLKNGINGIYAELSNAYISTYSGQEFTAALLEPAISDQSNGQNSKLTPYGEKLCKVFLTLLPILDTSLTVLTNNCRSLAGQHLNRSTDLGRLLGELGYNVPGDGDQSGELNRHVTGKGITVLLVGDYKRVFNSDKDTKNALGILLECLDDYYKACHYVTLSSTRSPCSVYEMLCWLTGLKYNCVYDKLRKCIKMCHEEHTENSLYPTALTADALVSAVNSLTADSPTLLTRVLGYGNAFTTYAVDFYNNSLQLYYPQDGEDCLHMMLHYLCLLLSVLRHLLSQCSLAAHNGGWAECKYGRGVPPYTWQCDPPVTALPTPHPECTDKSPLMSYLNDCLPGHLPHQLVSVGCEPKCKTCPNSEPGMPCLIPLGFRGFSGSTKTGKQLCEVLTKLFTNEHLSSLLSLEPRPPATLAEHFAFALSLVADWHDGNIVPKNSLQQALEASATDLSLRLSLTAAYGSDSAKHGGCKHPHLMHLAASDFCTRHQASPFLSTLCRGMYDSLAHRHSDLYLSWAIYLPWTFYEMLLCLYTAFKEISCRDWGCGDCLHEGPCDEGSHGVRTPQSPASGCRCPSIVQCRGVMPTLYSYGLTFRDASALVLQEKSCFNFHTQLSYVLNSDHFRDLFDRCDQFLWKIRTPFLYTVFSLWLIATLYILHSLLYRMDVLRIRSHLMRTKASHFIAVKALLTKGRKMLSLYRDVDYFDDDPLDLSQ
ncbi:Extracellular matrix-binding ebh, putative [Babesia ovata]|uniref:Extracellular matrix-binding ebh, putative n=1 Tax=Babesia ovata TaxID=189622 RepID=A0A2H6K6R2_9APIC|nr:Extracellular matrix-binding ebh, putative [Babesia ovata]GBE58669.1 Extracellular matrix-binding ebh, putative [Babesia ovata]